jgi:UDP-N-acetylmuramate--alanine ligase
MKDLAGIKNLYFLGIGGIGMSALARYFAARGILVRGYDKTPSVLTAELEKEGMVLHYQDDPAMVAPDTGMVVYTPAIPAHLQEFIRAKELGLPMMKRSEVLGMITRGHKTVAVAGTHGKTSVSSMITHILVSAGFPVTGLIGGISKNYRTNYISRGEEGIMVVEADEYDRSFLHLSPDIALISSMDADHMDIYSTYGQLLGSFQAFARKVRPGGRLVARQGTLDMLPSDLNVTEYGLGPEPEFGTEKIYVRAGRYHFTLRLQGEILREIITSVPGRHNIENGVAAATVCHILGVSKEDICRGLESYAGVARRFDVRFASREHVYIDDYAHHPKEITAFLEAVRELYPGQAVTGIFQPHLFSRTRDFAEGFARALESLDNIFLMEIYPAREQPIPGVSSDLIAGYIRNQHKLVVTRKDLLDKIGHDPPGLLVTMGAGDIDQIVEPIEKIYREL